MHRLWERAFKKEPDQLGVVKSKKGEITRVTSYHQGGDKRATAIKGGFRKTFELSKEVKRLVGEAEGCRGLRTLGQRKPVSDMVKRKKNGFSDEGGVAMERRIGHRYMGK